ncbi:flavodoxin [Kineosporia mesophila]|uniref:Flavodoxin n=1 Tax=Kineosporia mesophila TaxID=566012 RepID=A0ABP6ZM31_9ACTN|nr:flavodoxin [Kineosporia mesophila]MCD5354448.1 NAD(P)H-dependent oxidoreductase [Kineosporia mesophila]
MTSFISRRLLLQNGLIGAALTATMTGCSSDEPVSTTPEATRASTDPAPSVPGAGVLLVYFSRAGENYFNGGRRVLEVGNTEVLADMITERIKCDVYRIEAADSYPEAYEPTVQRNSQEQEDDARPKIAEPLPDLNTYDTVLIGSPVWGTQAPMIMRTFIENAGLAGKTVLPFVTYAVSGMSGVDADYREALPDTRVGQGLAVRGETVSDAAEELEAWLTAAGLN